MGHTKDNPLIFLAYEEAGTRRVCQWTEDGRIKTQYYSRWLWEKVNGKIPKNVIIIYKDGDAMNDCIENYEAMSKSHFMCKYLKEHKDNSGYSKRWSKIAGDTDLDKLKTILIKYSIRNFQELHDITSIDLGQLSRIRNKGYGLGLTNIKRIFDALDKM